jgi:hypothetical protein
MRIAKFTCGLLAVAALICAGCTESTTQKDVAKAKQNLRQAQQDTQLAARDAQQDVADAQQGARTVNKPVVSNEDMVDAQRKVTNAQQKGAERVAERKDEEREAAAKLAKTQREFEAAKARDAFAAQADGELAKADQQIEQLEAQAKAATGATKDALDQKIKAVKLERDNAKSHLSELKKSDLDKWDIHKQAVQSALQDLMRDLSATR